MNGPWAHVAPDALNAAWPPGTPPGGAPRRVALSPEVAHHLGRVLRLREGEALTAFDGQGRTAEASFQPENKGGHLLVAGPRLHPKPLGLALVAAMAKGEKPEWVVQKATELGATWIGLGLSQRSIARPDEGKAEAKLERWKAIALEACAQSEQPWMPELHWLGPLKAPYWPEGHQGLVLEIREHEGQSPEPLAKRLPSQAPVALLVGPEGGWAPAELSAMLGTGAQLARLGQGVMRAETAALAALAAVQALREA